MTKGIDNQILTSFRTLTKANNVVSDTLKIVHNKFNPSGLGAGAKKMKKQQLYVINEELLNQMATEEDENGSQMEDENGDMEEPSPRLI